MLRAARRLTTRNLHRKLGTTAHDSTYDHGAPHPKRLFDFERHQPNLIMDLTQESNFVDNNGRRPVNYLQKGMELLQLDPLQDEHSQHDTTFCNAMEELLIPKIGPNITLDIASIPIPSFISGLRQTIKLFSRVNFSCVHAPQSLTRFLENLKLPPTDYEAHNNLDTLAEHVRSGDMIYLPLGSHNVAGQSLTPMEVQTIANISLRKGTWIILGDPRIDLRLPGNDDSIFKLLLARGCNIILISSGPQVALSDWGHLLVASRSHHRSRNEAQQIIKFLKNKQPDTFSQLPHECVARVISDPVRREKWIYECNKIVDEVKTRREVAIRFCDYFLIPNEHTKSGSGYFGSFNLSPGMINHLKNQFNIHLPEDGRIPFNLLTNAYIFPDGCINSDIHRGSLMPFLFALYKTMQHFDQIPTIDEWMPIYRIVEQHCPSDAFVSSKSLNKWHKKRQELIIEHTCRHLEVELGKNNQPKGGFIFHGLYNDDLTYLTEKGVIIPEDRTLTLEQIQTAGLVLSSKALNDNNGKIFHQEDLGVLNFCYALKTVCARRLEQVTAATSQRPSLYTL